MQEICSYGSVGEPPGDWRLYPEGRRARISPGAGEASGPKPSNGTQWVIKPHPGKLATPGSEFCVVVSDDGTKRKQRVLRLWD